MHYPYVKSDQRMVVGEGLVSNNNSTVRHTGIYILHLFVVVIIDFALCLVVDHCDHFPSAHCCKQTRLLPAM